MTRVAPLAAADGGVPKLLLFSHVAPRSDSVGGVFLRDLCAAYPSEALAVCVVGDSDRVELPDLPGVRVAALPRMPEYGFNRLGRRFTAMTRAAAEAVARRTRLPRVLSRAAEFGRSFGAQIVWVPLASPTTIAAAEPLARRLNARLVTTVWDPPEYMLREGWGLAGGAMDGYLAAFGGALRASEGCGLMSEAMRVAYERRFGTAGVIMRHGVDEALWQPVAKSPHADTFTIGFAGSLYAREEWAALLAALDRSGWRVAGRRARIRVCAASWDMRLSGPGNVELLGWRSIGETVGALASCDVSYLPYWLDPQFDLVTRLAFPTKLSTYLAAGRPVLFHGPPQSSPWRFFDEYDAAIRCDSNDAAAILAALERVVASPAHYARMADEGRRALREQFTVERFRRAFAELLRVDAARLQPPGLAARG